MTHYFDYAATSAVRPPEVVQAIGDFLRNVGCTPGRGGHSGSVEAARIAFRCRRELAQVMGFSGDPGRIAFMQNATEALNTALHGFLGEGDTVVISQYEHNAVLRPVYHLSRTRNVEVRLLAGDPGGDFDLDQAAMLLEGARLLVINAASNVLGTMAPLASLARIAHSVGAAVLVDAAQSAGHSDQALAGSGADMVAFTGHKGLLGPQGTGGLWVREGIEIDPLLHGGTGGDSRRREMPPSLPDRLEAGTGNAPGLAGLLAGCRFVRDKGLPTLHARAMSLKASLLDGFSAVPGLRVLSPPAPGGIPIVTVKADHMDAGSLAERLDRDHEVRTRAGLHCAPEVHRILGTYDEGAVRFSMGWASTVADVEAAVAAVDAVVGAVSVPVGGRR